MVKNKKFIFIEDLQQLVIEITSCHVEMPRHFMEPLFILTNEYL